MEYIINVSEVEELQMLRNTYELEQIFSRAQSTVIQGGTVVLIRENADGTTYRFEERTSESDVEIYKENVFKYL